MDAASWNDQGSGSLGGQDALSAWMFTEAGYHSATSALQLGKLCVAVGCDVPPSSQPRYCQNRKLCSSHLKAFSLTRKDDPYQLEQRFCFQCGKLELLEAFDGSKRSCRLQLAKRRTSSFRAASTSSSAGSADKSRLRPVGGGVRKVSSFNSLDIAALQQQQQGLQQQQQQQQQQVHGQEHELSSRLQVIKQQLSAVQMQIQLLKQQQEVESQLASLHVEYTQLLQQQQQQQQQWAPAGLLPTLSGGGAAAASEAGSASLLHTLSAPIPSLASFGAGSSATLPSIGGWPPVAAGAASASSGFSGGLPPLAAGRSSSIRAPNMLPARLDAAGCSAPVPSLAVLDSMASGCDAVTAAEGSSRGLHSVSLGLGSLGPPLPPAAAAWAAAAGDGTGWGAHMQAAPQPRTMMMMASQAAPAAAAAAAPAPAASAAPLGTIDEHTVDIDGLLHDDIPDLEALLAGGAQFQPIEPSAASAEPLPVLAPGRTTAAPAAAGSSAGTFSRSWRGGVLQASGAPAAHHPAVRSSLDGYPGFLEELSAIYPGYPHT